MMSSFRLFNANLLKFEKYSIKPVQIVQYSEPPEFWSIFLPPVSSRNGQSPKSLQATLLQKLKEGGIYKKNIEWNSWLCYLSSESSSNVSKSSRSKQSLYSYAEENDKKNKCVLFVYPEFQEPFYFFDLDDLQNDGYALLVDPLKQVWFFGLIISKLISLNIGILF